MSPNTLTIEPLLSAADREELAHLDYLLSRMVELRDRGLIAVDSFATVLAESQGRREAIERQGRYQAAMKQAMMLVKSDPEAALRWAEHACELDPSKSKPWELLVSLNWTLEQDDEAISHCVDAAKRFPEFQAELERLEGERAGRAEVRQRQAEQAARTVKSAPGWRRRERPLTSAVISMRSRSASRFLRPGPTILAHFRSRRTPISGLESLTRPWLFMSCSSAFNRGTPVGRNGCGRSNFDEMFSG